MKPHQTICAVLGLLLLVFPATQASADVPRQINYQGMLTDADGQPVADDSYAMTFAIYDAATGGTALWSEAQTVAVSGGVYNVTLGQPGNGIDPADLDGDRYLGVSVGGDAEMTPRQPITAAAFSLRAALADDADTLDGLEAIDFASSTHAHSAAEITSGTLATGYYSAVSDLGVEGYLGNASGDISQNNGTRQVNLNADLLDGLSSAAFMSAGTDNWVDVAGDTMTGTLDLATNLVLPATTATTGIIRSGSSTLIHRYGTRNFFAGLSAGNLTMTGNQNTGTGYYALRSNADGEYNTAGGAFSLYNNTEGLNNTASGYDSLRLNTTGDDNTASGSSALRSNTHGDNNTAGGSSALRSNTTGHNNTASGYRALYSNTNGFSNTASGINALYSNITGAWNSASGSQALYSNTTGSQNTAVGSNALYSNTIGAQNTATGFQALSSNSTGGFNTASGFCALCYNTTGNRNTAVGAYSLGSQDFNNGDTAWFSNNTAVGYGALAENNPTAIVNGINNTALGALALGNNGTGHSNTAGGSSALQSNETGYRNTAVGYNALGANTTAIHGTALGYNAGASSTTGNGNTLIGCDSDVSASNLINGTALGYGAIVNGSNRVRIGNTYVSQIGGNVGWSNLSDIRGKEDIEDITLGLDFINALRPVEFRLINGNGRLDLGFVAQDIEAILGRDYNLLGIAEDSDRTLSLRYTDFIAPMVKAVQEQQAEIEAQQETIARQEGIITQLQSAVAQLQAQMAAIKTAR